MRSHRHIRNSYSCIVNTMETEGRTLIWLCCTAGMTWYESGDDCGYDDSREYVDCTKPLYLSRRAFDRCCRAAQVREM